MAVICFHFKKSAPYLPAIEPKKIQIFLIDEFMRKLFLQLFLKADGKNKLFVQKWARVCTSNEEIAYFILASLLGKKKDAHRTPTKKLHQQTQFSH
jgi:hypothetical protein